LVCKVCQHGGLLVPLPMLWTATGYSEEVEHRSGITVISGSFFTLKQSNC
jgi:hypothetical protein